MKYLVYCTGLMIFYIRVDSGSKKIMWGSRSAWLALSKSIWWNDKKADGLERFCKFVLVQNHHRPVREKLSADGQESWAARYRTIQVHPKPSNKASLLIKTRVFSTLTTKKIMGYIAHDADWCWVTRVENARLPRRALCLVGLRVLLVLSK